MKTAVKNARLVTSESVIDGGVCVYEDGIITYVGCEECEADNVIDAKGAYLVPGFVDIHCHGCLGLAFNGADINDVKTIADYHLSKGTTSMLATTSTSSIEEIEEALAACEQYIKTEKNPSIAGIFMEGPWLSPAQCGAQATVYMLKPSVSQLRELKAKYPSIVRVGASPELDGGAEFGEAACELGLVASVTHSDANFSEVEESMKHGYNLMTHLYSGMKGTERKNAYRIPGAVEAGLYFDDMFVEIIADGKHLPPELLKYIYKLKGADRICLITDAIRAAGLPNGAVTTGVSKINNAKVIVEDDVGKLPDRTAFAGSTATADRLYRTMAEAIGRDMVALSKMASLTPASLVGLHDRGEIKVGKRADLVILDENLEVVNVILNGEPV
jgi:N-acetylglucosamine-6-phosphate deacetylase